ncbi:WXG100 family type VII secretion target [Streptosporangium canum]|uniref:WXG100 family type VII secretion target n=1 Tax=Streptosporangium canum TaxID=324952 RepID=UPI0036887038
MGSESKVLIIRSSAAVPQADGVTQTKDQIKELLRNTAPVSIDDAGFAYGNAAGTVDLVCGALQRVAGELAKVWGGDAAVEVQKALQMLHATGTELASKMEQMSSTLRLYGGTYLPQAIEKINKLETQGGTSTVPPSSNAGTSPAAADVEAANEAARKVLRELNEKIVELYNDRVPPHVSYELPTVSLPGGPSSYTKTGYPNGGSPYRGDSTGSGNGSAGSGTSGSSWSPGSGTGSSGSSGSDPGGSGPGGPGSDGPGSDGSGPKGSDPADPGSNGTDPGGSGSDGTGSPGSGDGASGADGGNGNGQSPADGANGSDHGKGADGTAPAVIGGNEDASRHDPRSTETAGLNQQPVTALAPPNSVVPTTVAPPTTSFGPANAVSPVLGGPGAGPGAGVGTLGVGGTGSAALARGTIGNSGMMPMMPMGGGMGQEGGEEHETSVYLPEKDHWESEHDVTSSCIR